MNDWAFSQYGADPYDVLAKTLVGEGSPAHWPGIGGVIMNRAADERWPSTPWEVATQHNGKGTHQFSAWNGNLGGGDLAGLGPGDARYDEAYAFAQNMLGGSFEDPTDGATHYYSPAGMRAYVDRGIQSNTVPGWLESEAARGAPRRAGPDHIFVGKANIPEGHMAVAYDHAGRPVQMSNGAPEVALDPALFGLAGSPAGASPAAAPAGPGFAPAPQGDRSAAARGWEWIGSDGFVPTFLGGLAMMAGGEQAVAPAFGAITDAWGTDRETMQAQERAAAALAQYEGVLSPDKFAMVKAHMASGDTEGALALASSLAEGDRLTAYQQATLDGQAADRALRERSLDADIQMNRYETVEGPNGAVYIRDKLQGGAPTLSGRGAQAAGGTAADGPAASRGSIARAAGGGAPAQAPAAASGPAFGPAMPPGFAGAALGRAGFANGAAGAEAAKTGVDPRGERPDPAVQPKPQPAAPPGMSTLVEGKAPNPYNDDAIDSAEKVAKRYDRNTAEYTARVEGYTDMAANADAAKAGDEKAQLALAVGFAKALDPGSVAREGEVAAISNAPGLPGWLQGEIVNGLRGQRMTPKAVDAMMAIAQDRLKARQGEVDQQYQSATQVMEGMGIPRDIQRSMVREPYLPGYDDGRGMPAMPREQSLDTARYGAARQAAAGKSTEELLSAITGVSGGGTGPVRARIPQGPGFAPGARPAPVPQPAVPSITDRLRGGRRAR